MYAQTLQFPKHIVHNSPLKQQQKVAVSPKSELRLFNSAKGVRQPSVISRKSCHFFVTRCGGSQEKHELNQQNKFDDGYYMRRCVEIARKAIGHTSPNPMVGCVIVKDGKIVGEGFHPKAGQPHAELKRCSEQTEYSSLPSSSSSRTVARYDLVELDLELERFMSSSSSSPCYAAVCFVFALRDAGDLAENATAYVSLEPCNHHGRTPPCTEALIKAKVKNVVIGMVDPNPIVASTGVKKLQDAGIGVTVGVEEELCKRLVEAFIHHITTGKPFVTLRYSMSLDGHILNKLGEDAMEYGGYYSKLLQEYDAIILSSTTLTDKSSLPMSKEPGAKQPLKLILSKGANPITQIPVLNNNTTSKVTIISEKGTSLEPQAGQERIEMLSFDRINLLEILAYCKRQGLFSVLLDLIGNNGDFDDILKEGFEQNLFQKVVVEVLPDFGGGQERVLKYMDLKEKVKKLTSYVSGKSVVLEGYF